MTLTFDKNTANQRSLELDFFTEQIFDKRLSGTWERIVGNDFSAPVVENFQQEFTTLEIVSDDQTIPIIGSYSSIANINVSYNEQSHLYNLTIIIV